MKLSTFLVCLLVIASLVYISYLAVKKSFQYKLGGEITVETGDNGETLITFGAKILEA